MSSILHGLAFVSSLWLTLANASPVASPAPGLKCYYRSDLDFFPPKPNARTLQESSCVVALDTLTGNIQSDGSDSATFWYTSSHARPSGLDPRAQQLPVTSQVHGCGLVVLSTKSLIDLTSSAAIAWRPEWGAQDSETAKEVFTDVKPAQWTGKQGIADLLTCASNGGQAGHITLDGTGTDEQLHAFIWSGAESKFTKLYDILQ